MFKRTSLPVARSIHYQLIDIQLDEVQQMVHSNDGQVRERKYFFFSSFFYMRIKMMQRFVTTGAFFLLPSINTPVGFDKRIERVELKCFYACINN
jgi:hypothetical protein